MVNIVTGRVSFGNGEPKSVIAKVTERRANKMVHNTQEDLNNFLFSELERLNDPDLKDDELRTEMSRADSVAKTAMAIISNWDLSVKLARARADAVGVVDMPPMLGGGQNDSNKKNK